MAARLDQKPPLHELAEYANVGDRWKEVGILLKLDCKDLDTIDAEHQKVFNKLSSMYDNSLAEPDRSVRRVWFGSARLV